MISSNRLRGFTLIELIVTVVVAAILLTAAAPGFRDIIAGNRITTVTNRLISDVQLARTEAMRRGARLVLCRSADPTAAAPTCGGTAQTWTTGWLLFVDSDRNGSFNGADALLRRSEVDNRNITVMSNGAADATAQFNADSSTNSAGNTLSFVICDDRGTGFGKRIEIPPVGRPRLANVVDSCSNPA